MQRMSAILLFYRPMFLWSCIATLVITILNPYIFFAVITKLVLTLFAWHLVKETKARKKLRAFNKLGLTTFRLFSMLYVIDIFITIGFLVIIKQFI
ncbi:hypothetical protein RM697_11415 [Ichthyenterobacterium sp. W332]|uniref:Uncharacterized protein n=1 Tax=Microcosmobacter mediterraneus TaxID=3075607 RepID=A0ABU2YM77_9FLAO|nr:hypothetical protein [Ichthyenterobacterium sp. W332]MDT0559263.1 hypothetical protein [Ichthyenterobacterium sp. W332]